jgi:hypothetical protein
MAVCVSPVDSDISCTAASKNRTEQTPKWSDDKLKSLWSSLLNLELVSKHHEDLELQGILLLLETTFGIFKSKCYIWLHTQYTLYLISSIFAPNNGRK